MEPSLAELNHKIDALTAQVAYLTEQARLAEGQRQARAELMRDLTPIANEAFRLTVQQLEEVQEYIDLGDLLRLAKRLARNGRHLETILDQIESMMDLIETVGPITDEAFSKTVDLMSELERKGYFALARGGMRLLDHMVTQISEEDLDLLSENIAPILDTLKELTQPEVIDSVCNTLLAAKQAVQQPVDSSLFSLMKQLNDPSVRRGLALSLRLLQAIGSQAQTT